jgi:hypothetical protein
MLFAKVWPTAAAEPPGWMITVSDLSLAAGQGGIRVVAQNDTVINVTSFLETTATSSV